MPVKKIAKTAVKKGKGKKSSGNKGNPATNRRKKSAKKVPVANKNYGMIGKSAIDISKWNLPAKDNNDGTQSNSVPANTNQVEAIGQLTKGNGKLAEFLKEATGGSTSLLDWANFFKAVPKEKQAEIIAESRMDNDVDESPGTIAKIKQYAMDAAGIYARATGKDINTGEAEAAALAAKEKQKTNTMFIIGGIIITVLIVVAVLFRSPGKKYV